MKIIQITDCHLFADINKTGYANVNPYKSLTKVLSLVADCRPDWLVATGDISGDSTANSYQHFLQLVESFGLLNKLRTLPGNHDSGEQYGKYLSDFDLTAKGPIENRYWAVHGVDTRHKGTLGFLSTTKLQTLMKQIVSQSDKQHVVLCHHHPIECGGWMDKHEWLNRHEFLSAIAQLSQIKLVQYGHIHMAIEQQLGDCLLVSTPSTCWQWRNQADFAVADAPPGFRVTLLNDDASFSTQGH